VNEEKLESKAGVPEFCDPYMNHDRVVVVSRLVEVAGGVHNHIIEALDGASLLHEVQISEIVDPTNIHVSEIVTVEHDAHGIGFIESYTDFGREGKVRSLWRGGRRGGQGNSLLCE
jgi:hypothetical protein